MVFRQVQGYLKPRLIQARYVSDIFSHIYNVRYMEAYLATFKYISVDEEYSEYWHSQKYIHILCVQAYSEPWKYLASFWHYSRAIYAYSDRSLGKFRHIQNSGLFRYVIFYANSGIFTKLDILRHFCSLFKSIQSIFSFLFQKTLKNLYKNNNNNSMPQTLARHPRHQFFHKQHAISQTR